MVIGGTNINRERNGLARARCDVLVATPGRLQDHIDTTEGFAGRLWGIQVRPLCSGAGLWACCRHCVGEGGLLLACCCCFSAVFWVGLGASRALLGLGDIARAATCW